MTYTIYTKDKNGNVEVFASVSDKNDAVSAVKLAESYWAYINAWYVRTD